MIEKCLSLLILLPYLESPCVIDLFLNFWGSYDLSQKHLVNTYVVGIKNEYKWNKFLGNHSQIVVRSEDVYYFFLKILTFNATTMDNIVWRSKVFFFYLRVVFTTRCVDSSALSWVPVSASRSSRRWRGLKESF